MTPRPFYRSRLFWLGLPGLVFLLWLWLLFSPKAICIDAGQRSFDVLSFPSAIEFTTSEDRNAFPSWEVDVWPLEEEDRVDPGDHLFKWDYDERYAGIPAGGGSFVSGFWRQHYLSMRPWLPSAAYLVLWLAAVAWWQRRKYRLLKLHAAP